MSIDYRRAKWTRKIQGTAGVEDTFEGRESVSSLCWMSVGVSDLPQSSARKKERPIPTGARNVALCFTTASMIITNTSWAVKNISMNKPWDMDVPPPKVVSTLRLFGNRQDATPAAAMPPRICAMTTRTLRTAGNPPTRKSARVTCHTDYMSEMQQSFPHMMHVVWWTLPMDWIDRLWCDKMPRRSLSKRIRMLVMHTAKQMDWGSIRGAALACWRSESLQMTTKET